MNACLLNPRVAIVIGLLCSALTLDTVQAANESPADQAIADLRHKAFRIATVNGVQSMTVIPDRSGRPSEQAWWADGHAKPCINNVAHLSRVETAASIHGGKGVLALLDCPAANDAEAESIVALFDSKTTDVPQCFGRIHLLDKHRHHFWGAVKKIEVRKQADGAHVVAATLQGGDAGDSWQSYAFIHVDGACRLTLLSKFYAFMARQTDDSGRCSGEKLAFSFKSDFTAEIRKYKILCSKRGEKSTPVMRTMLDFDQLLRMPERRTVEP